MNLTPLIPAQAETNLSTSTGVAQGPLPFSEKALESSAHTQNVVESPESTQGTLVPSAQTQSDLAPSPSSSGVLRPSPSVRGHTRFVHIHRKGSKTYSQLYCTSEKEIKTFSCNEKGP